ncbi:MAG: hypothetical protein FWE62_06450 [Firmicutes bacterium]|nr:hypothetical protein [Bacillota bacterium]
MKEMSGEQLTLLAMGAALKMAKENDPDEVMILSDFFVLVGTILLLLHDTAALTVGGTADNEDTANENAANGGSAAKNTTTDGFTDSKS